MSILECPLYCQTDVPLQNKTFSSARSYEVELCGMPAWFCSKTNNLLQIYYAYIIILLLSDAYCIKCHFYADDANIYVSSQKAEEFFSDLFLVKQNIKYNLK